LKLLELEGSKREKMRSFLPPRVDLSALENSASFSITHDKWALIITSQSVGGLGFLDLFFFLLNLLGIPLSISSSSSDASLSLMSRLVCYFGID